MLFLFSRPPESFVCSVRIPCREPYRPRPSAFVRKPAALPSGFVREPPVFLFLPGLLFLPAFLFLPFFLLPLSPPLLPAVSVFFFRYCRPLFQTEWNSQNPEIPVKRIFVFTGIIFQTEAGKMQKPCHPYYAVRLPSAGTSPFARYLTGTKRITRRARIRTASMTEQDNAQYF